MKLIPIKVLLISSVVIISCSQKKTAIPGKTEDSGNKIPTTHEIDSLNEKAASELSMKNNAFVGWDTVLTYSYQLQNLLDTGNKVIPFIGYITDIVKVDSNYLLKVSGDYENIRDKHCYAEILVSSQKFQELNRLLFSKSFERTGCFIIRNTKLKTIKSLSIDSEVQGQEQVSDENENYVDGDALYSEVTYEFEGKLFILKGQLLDFYLNKNKDWFKVVE